MRFVRHELELINAYFVAILDYYEQSEERGSLIIDQIPAAQKSKEASSLR
jgi:hypothetical protein